MNASSSKYLHTQSIPDIRYTIKRFIIHVYILYAGTSTLLSENPALITSAEIEDSSQPICRKDTGQKKKLRKWSRGHQFVVRGGGTLTAGLLFSSMTVTIILNLS